MQDVFINRLGMFNTTLDTLNEAGHKAVWFQQAPVIFTTKVAQAKQAVTDLEAFCRQQSSAIGGVTQDKAREEKEAVDVAYPLARLLVEWFRDHNDETNAAKVNLALSDFRRLRDQAAVNKLREVRDLGKSLTTNQDAQTVTDAATYGITAAVVQAVDKEVEEYAAVLNAPSASISQRAALSTQMRDRFNAVEDKFASLDNLIHGFNTTPQGRALIASYQASRIVRDHGHSPAHTTTPATP